MTEERSEQLDSEEAPIQDEQGNGAPVEGDQLAEEPVEKGKAGWPVAVGVVAVILALCTLIACCALAIIAFSATTDKTPTAPPEPVPTKAGATPTTPASGAMIVIAEPDQGQVVDITKPIKVYGRGVGLPEGNVVVEALDWQGKLLDRQAATLEGKDVGTGGEGEWSAELRIETQPGTAGKIRAYSTSAKDGSVIAEDIVEVSLGSTPKVEAYIQITEPAQGAQLDIDRPVVVRGSGAGLHEGNVIVQALDQQGKVLDEQATTLQGPNVGTGGEGTWTAELNIQTDPGTAGTILASSPSPKDGSIIAEDSVGVSMGSTPAVPAFLEIDSPADGAVVDITGPVRASGQGGGLPEGNVIVQALDDDGRVLAEQATTLQGEDVGAGGAGTWSVDLRVGAVPGTTGRVVAFSPSGKGGNVASAVAHVTYGEAASLEGPTWIWDQSPPGTEITALFQEGRVGGSAGCNTYQGGYTASGSSAQGSIEFSPFAVTMMMCDEQVMDLETEFLAGLESSTRYVVEGHALTFTYSGGSLLFYDAAGPRPRS